MGKWVCRNCETENAEDAVKCSLCGEKRETAELIADGTKRPANDVRPQPPVREHKGSADSEGKTGGLSIEEAVRKLAGQYEGQKKPFRVLITGCVFLQIILAAVAAVRQPNIGRFSGGNGIIVVFVMLFAAVTVPLIAAWIRPKDKNASHPVVIALFAALITTIFCTIGWIELPFLRVSFALIMLLSWAIVLCAVRLVKLHRAAIMAGIHNE